MDACIRTHRLLCMCIPCFACADKCSCETLFLPSLSLLACAQHQVEPSGDDAMRCLLVMTGAAVQPLSSPFLSLLARDIRLSLPGMTPCAASRSWRAAGQSSSKSNQRSNEQS
eukprot:1139684-Pelagomonas_calceolata.AAC.1